MTSVVGSGWTRMLTGIPTRIGLPQPAQQAASFSTSCSRQFPHFSVVRLKNLAMRPNRGPFAAPNAKLPMVGCSYSHTVWPHAPVADGVSGSFGAMRQGIPSGRMQGMTGFGP